MAFILAFILASTSSLVISISPLPKILLPLIVIPFSTTKAVSFKVKVFPSILLLLYHMFSKNSQTTKNKFSISKNEITLLQNHGWKIISLDNLHIEHIDGSIASQNASLLILKELKSDYITNSFLQKCRQLFYRHIPFCKNAEKPVAVIIRTESAGRNKFLSVSRKIAESSTMVFYQNSVFRF